MTDQPQSEHCDIENQCTHFCVYKGRYCPVYLRISRPRTPAPEPLASTKDMVQERQTKSPDARYQLCRSEPSKHVCINCDEAARTATLTYRKDLHKIISDLLDAGFKNPLVTFEAATAYLENPTIRGHPEMQQLKPKNKPRTAQEQQR